MLYNDTTGVISIDSGAVFSGKTTDDLAQGTTNKYFTTIGAAVNTTNLPEGTNLYYTDARVQTKVANLTGNVTTTANASASYFIGDGSLLSNITHPADAVTSVNGQTGVVVLDTDDIDEGSANLYYTDARVGEFLANTDSLLYQLKSNVALFAGDINNPNEFQVINNMSLDYKDLIWSQTAYDHEINLAAGALVLSTTAVGDGDTYLTANISAGIDTGPGSGTDRILNLQAGANTFIAISQETATPFSPTANVYGNLYSNSSITTEANVSAQEFIGNSINSTAGFAINSGDGTIVTSPFGADSTVTETANIAGKGYGIFNSTGTEGILTYSGTSLFEWYEIDGSTTAGSTTLTISNIVRGIDSSAATIGDMNVGQVIDNGTATVFARDAYVVSINTGAGTVEMSQPAISTQSFTFSADGTILDAGIIDTTTGLVVGLYSDLRVTGAGSDSALNQIGIYNYPYGYPATGPEANDFDIFTTGTVTDYAVGDYSAYTIGQTPVTNTRTALNAPLGITIGESTQLTNRGENDQFRSFGVNMLWDGTDSTVVTPIQPQILFKQYTDNTQQKLAAGSAGPSGAGPRLFFSSATGNADVDAYSTYPRINQELGRLSFWGTTGTQLTPSSYNVPGFISVAAADNWDTWGGGTAGNTNVYMGATSNGVNPDTYLSYKGGELFLGGGNSKPVTLAPAHNGTALSLENAYSGAVTTWANANYASGTTGAKFTVTNGGSVDAGVVGDMELGVKRVDNSSTVTEAITTTFSSTLLGGALPNGWILCVLPFGSTFNGKTATISAAGTIVASATGNETALGGNTYTFSYVYTGGSGDIFYISSGGVPVSYTSIGGADNYSPVTQNLGMSGSYIVSSGVTAKEWKFALEEQSEDLKLQSDGTTVMHFTDARVFVDEVFRFQNLTTTEINALASPESGDTVYNTTENKICFYNGTAWQKVTSATM